MSLALTIFFLCSLLLLWVLFWRYWQHEDERSEALDDARITPLLRGINYLLSDEPDLALQQMVKVAKLRSEAIDVYMALGEMFRAQGEFGRAVRIHQNILARPDLGQPVYMMAHFALGKDFQLGGLLDRSLRHYQKVLDVDSGHLDALMSSLRIREQSHEWLEAEALLSRIERLRGDVDTLHRAYLWAELSEDALKEAAVDVACDYAEKALLLADNCAHAHQVLLNLALDEGALDKVHERVRLICKLVPTHLPLLLSCLSRHDDIYHELLLEVWRDSHDDEFAVIWLETVAKSDVQAALRLKTEIQFVPKSLRHSLRLTALGLNADIALVAQAKQWRSVMKQYACVQCGVHTVEVRWQCPQCHLWGSMRATTSDDV
ncbi:MAG: heat-shock protein [Mariprofundaceae bacterium]